MDLHELYDVYCYVEEMQGKKDATFLQPQGFVGWNVLINHWP